jgi:hypothetical protein
MKSYSLLLVLMSLCGFLGLTGCGTYQLQGVVVSGKTPRIEVVDKDDKRLTYGMIEDVTITAIFEPNEMRPKVLDNAITDADGRFSIPIDATGVGFLEYEVSIAAQGINTLPAEKTIKVPGAGKRVLITLPTGRATRYERPKDILHETMQMKDQLLR